MSKVQPDCPAAPYGGLLTGSLSRSYARGFPRAGSNREGAMGGG